MAEKAGKSGKCPECGTDHAAARGNCPPLSERQGPAVTDPNHPSNNGSWARTLTALTVQNVGKVFGPFTGQPGAAPGAVKAPPAR